MIDKSSAVEAFRERLLEVIDSTGLSKSAFSRQAGIDRSTLSQILNSHQDRLPRIETLVAVARANQVSLDWLVGLSSEGNLGASFVPYRLQFSPGGAAPHDERLRGWHADAVGYKIRYVPSTIPDLLKTEEVIDYEFGRSVSVSPDARQSQSRERLEYQRRPETDMEVCTSYQSIEGFARGEGIWSGLEVAARKRQLAHMAELCRELYPTFRWFMFDALELYCVPITIFGPQRAVIYVGQSFFVITSQEHIRDLTAVFDDLIRRARYEPTRVMRWLVEQHDSVREAQSAEEGRE